MVVHVLGLLHRVVQRGAGCELPSGNANTVAAVGRSDDFWRTM